MVNTKFEVYKLRRELKRSGIAYIFLRRKVNSFGEPEEESPEEVVGCLYGMYHEQNSNVAIVTGDTTQTRTKKIPMIMCVFKDVSSIGLCVGDYLKINGKTFHVTGIVNVQEWNLIADISLEVVDDGV